MKNKIIISALLLGMVMSGNTESNISKNDGGKIRFGKRMGQGFLTKR